MVGQPRDHQRGWCEQAGCRLQVHEQPRSTIPWQARFIADTAQSGVLNYEQATSPEARKQGLTDAKLEETLIPATRDGDDFFSKMIFFQPVEDLQRRLDVWNEFKLGLGS